MSSTPSFKDYFKSLPNDLTASVVVFLVALPLCLGIALASNAPLFSGIIAGVIGGIVVGLASRSHLSVTGPAAGLSAIVAGSLALLPSFEAFLLAVVVAGVMQLILGFAKAGVIGDFVPGSVIKGMLAAIGFILMINQFPHILGDDSQFETDEESPRKGNIFSIFFYAFTNINSSAFIIGGSALLLNTVWEKFQKGKTGFIRFVPGPLLMVILGVAMNQLFKSQSWFPALTGEHLVILPMANTPTEFFSFFTSPDWSQLGNSAVLTVAVTLALVASLETLLSVEAVDELDPYQRVTPTNRELKAQGLGNIVSGLLGGLPVTSVIVRSSANVNSGAKTKMSTIYHGILLLFCVAFIPFLLNQIPKSALAAVLIFTGYKLAKPSLFIGFFKKGWNQFLPFVGTILAILATDLLKGVLIGIGIAIIFIIRSNFKSAVVITNDADKYLVRLRKDVSFLNKAILKQGLEKVPANSYIIIDVSRADFIDQDIIEIIEDFQKHAPLENIKVEIKKNPSSISILT
jgi:MFS superfamily sulfate permease-like transporter